MKKKILSFCLAFAVIVPAMFLLSACCGGNDTPKKDRTNTAEMLVFIKIIKQAFMSK